MANNPEPNATREPNQQPYPGLYWNPSGKELSLGNDEWYFLAHAPVVQIESGTFRFNSNFTYIPMVGWV